MRCRGWSIVAWSWPLEDGQHRVQAALSRITGAGLPDGREMLTHNEALNGRCGGHRTGSWFWEADRRVPVAFAEAAGRHDLMQRLGVEQMAAGWLAGPHQREVRRLHRPGHW